MKLVGLPGRSGTPFKVADVGAFFGDDQCPLELAGVGLVYAEVGHQLYGTAHTLWDVDKGTVTEDGRVQRGVEVISVGDHGTQVFLDQFRMLFHCFADRAEDYALFL